MSNDVQPEPTASPAGVVDATRKKSPALLIIGILAVIGAIWGVIAFLDARHYEATDDAYVNADIVLVASQVKGNLIELDVDDNQRVKAGQLIGRIDPTQYKANLEQANANLAIARAQVEAAKADIELTQRQGDAQIQSATGGASAASGGVGVAQAQIGITAAQLAAAEATESLERTDLDNLDRNVSAAEDALSRATAQAKAADGAVKAAQASAKAAVAQEESAQAAEQYAVRQYDRSQHLFAEDAISQNELDQAKLGLDNAKAAHESAQRQADAASEAVGERASDRDAAWIAVKAAENGVAQAKLQKQEGFDRLNGALAQVNAQKQSLAGAHQGAETAGGSLTRAQADVASAQTLPDKLKQKMAQEALAEAQVQQAEAAVANAKLDLDRTVLRAPASGSLSKCYVEVGDLMQIGSPVVNIVMDEAPSIYANFKETQVAQMKVGLPVDADIDGFPGHTFHGHIDSLSPATGSQFALIPPDNATGNFVKVVQRVPVKIVLKEDALTPKLAIGMSATVRVRVRD